MLRTRPFVASYSNFSTRPTDARPSSASWQSILTPEVLLQKTLVTLNHASCLWIVWDIEQPLHVPCGSLLLHFLRPEVHTPVAFDDLGDALRGHTAL